MIRRRNKVFHVVFLFIFILSIAAPLQTVFADYVSTAINRVFIDPAAANMAMVTNGYQVGDEISFIFETTPKITNGATAGAGAWSTVYLPAGVVVTSAELVAANSDGTYSAISAKDVAEMGVDCGDRDCRLAGGELQADVIANGSLGYNQQDTGIFYSTDSRTALLVTPLSISPTGPLVTPQEVHNQWDYDQIVAFGQGAAYSGNGGQGNAPIVSYNGGGTWFGTASPVAGPNTYYTHDYKPGATCMTIAPTTQTSSITAAIDDFSCEGPWQRIEYDNSKIANDIGTPVIAATGGGDKTYNNNSVLVTNTSPSAQDYVGYSVSSSTPLPATTNALRFVQGKRFVGDLELARITLKITERDDFLDAINSGSEFCLDATGGDQDRASGGSDKDNIWRYYEGNNHVCFQGNTNAILLKQAKYVNGDLSNGGGLSSGDVVGYEISFTNTGLLPITNLVITDTVDSNLAFVTTFPNANCPYDGVDLSSSYIGSYSSGTAPTINTLTSTVATWNALPSLGSGETVSVFICGIASGNDGDHVKNTARALYDGETEALSSATLGTITTQLSGTVYSDLDQTGTFTAGDTGLAGVTVTLYEDLTGDGYSVDDLPMGTTHTDSSGGYIFNSLTSGIDYVILETNLASYLSTGDTQGANDDEILVNNLSGANNSGNDFFDYISPNADISGEVRYDVDGDGNLSDSDNGISGVTLTLDIIRNKFPLAKRV